MINVSVETVMIFGNIQILIEICLDVSVYFVSELISGYISSFFFVILLPLIAIWFEFWNLQYFKFEYYYLFLLFFVRNFTIADFISIFVDLVDLWFLVTTRQPNYLGGACVCVCVFGLF